MNIWTPEQEAENLKARFQDVNRAAFAREQNLKGGQSLIYQHINTLRPISLEAALVYAKGFSCSLEEISPRLAKEAIEAALQTGAQSTLQSLGSVKALDEIEIPQYLKLGGSMGNGLLLRDQPGEIHSWRVTSEWLTRNVRHHTGIANLCIVTGFGPSMKGMFNPGDPLLVDRGVKVVEVDAVYFFRVGNEGFIKTLQRVPGVGLRAISANKEFETWTITPDMDFEVFAQVLKVWKSEDF